MRDPIFTGAGTAIITPFEENGINYRKFGELIDFQIDNGIDAIVVCGTTGEASTMPDEEHKAAIDFAVRKTGKRVPVIAGAGSNDTKHAIDLSRYCQDAGADAILSVTPYYNKTSQEGLYRHFKSIADSVDIPVILYNVPSRTALNIEPSTLARLSEIENIVAVKECNFSQMLESRALCRSDFVFYSGEDGSIVPLLSLGGKGVISVMSNIIPAQTSKIVKDYLKGNTKESMELQIKLGDLIRALFCDVNPIPLKEAMNLMGMDVGLCRAPLVEMSLSGKERMKKTLIKYDLLQGDKL